MSIDWVSFILGVLGVITVEAVAIVVVAFRVAKKQMNVKVTAKK